MNIEHLNEIINALPLLMVYVVPGYIILRINGFQLSRAIDNDYYIFLKSTVLSFVLVTVLETLWNVFFPGIEPLSKIEFKIATIISAVIIGFVWSKFLVSDFCAKLLRKLGINRTFRLGIWSDVIDFEFGLWVMVYIAPDKVVYLGKLRRYVETEKGQMYTIFLSNYVLFDYESNVLQDYKEESDKWVALNSKDITRVEIYYHPKSKKILMNG
jgi:hypothetical protein